ncbi:LamG domain-containing protein, partial [Opitutales bacterium]|nr:LamG domain-containing protein [Opitutales bacterium]
SVGTSSLTNGIRIGVNHAASADYLDGNIAEFLILDETSSTDTIKKVEGYLAHKWGLTSSLPSNHTHKTVSLTRGPIVTTDATQGNAAGTYYVRPSDAASKKYSLTYVDGQFIKSSLTGQTIAWGQSFSNVGVGQTVDLNASVGSGLAVLYSVSDTSVAELAVTNQSSLQAWYKLDESSGDAADSSANSNVGSLRNSPAYNAGKFGNAITLDGTNDHIRAYNYPGIGSGDRRTIALWFKTSTANKPLLQYGASGTATLFKLSLNNSGAVVLDLGGTTITSSSASHANGAWHHVAVTIPANGNTGAAKLYVDGSRTNGSGSTAINTTSSVDLIIGRDGTSGSAYFNGQIDDVRFYGAELNSTLISQLYGNGNGDFNRLTVKTTGSVTITATQPGNNSYATAPASTITATFDKSDQTISFSPIPDKSVGDFDFSPTAVASSGLGVSFASSNNLIAEVQGTAPNQTIKIRAAGTATITASQAGDSSYNGASSVTQTLTVGYFNLQQDSLPGLKLWLDGNNINGDNTADTLTDNSAVTQWIDQSGNTNNAGQGTANAKPTYVTNALNGMGGVRFTAAQSLNITSSNDFVTVIAVMKQASNQTAETKPLGSNIFATTSAGKFGLKRQGSAWMDSGVSSHQVGIVTMQVYPGNYALFINGENKGTGTDPVTPDSATKVGNDFAGDIAELVAYNSILSQGVRHKIEGYLAHKWGLAGDLLSTHTYKNTKPAFGGAQNLTFQPISDKQAGQSADLSVSSDSGLSTFTYDSNDSSVVSFSYDANANSYKVNALKVGKVTITATQPGQSPWLSATATQPFIVTATPRVDQTITFVDIPNKTVQSANFDLNATASSGLPVSFVVVSGSSATVESNGTVTIVGAGVTTIRASQDGNGSYNPAPTVEKTLTVSKVPQAITFNALSDASLTAGTYELNATASSGLSVSFASSDSTVAEVSGNTLTLKKGGSITITSTQGGNGIYLAAPDITQSLTVIDDTQQAQTITWSQSLGSRAFGVADLDMNASSNANLPITYISSDSSIASIVNGNFLKVVGAGNATITATQAGNGQYQAASAVIKTVTVTKANQNIKTTGGSSTLPNLTKDNGDFEFAPALQSVKAGTTTTTGLALSYASSNSAVIEVTSGGTRLKPKGDGTATITVTQN